MVKLNVPKNLANQSITLKQYKTSVSNTGTRVKDEVKTSIDNVVVQAETIYSGTNNDRTVIANALVMLYAGVSTPIPKISVRDDLGNVIEYDGQEYTIKHITELKFPFSNELWGYELEVL